MKKWPYVFIFLMTIADATFTAQGVTQGIIKEANPLLKNFFTYSTILPCLTIVILTGLLLIVIYKCQNQIRWLNYGLALLIIVKLGVLVLHFNWIAKVMLYG